MLENLKIDLGITGTRYDDRLTEYLNYAQAKITEEGVTLDTSDIKDSNLIVMYAAWLWRKRENGEGMPRMMRYALNNRIMSEKAAVE